ncbi:MAG: type 1 glutamine amidotransferase [Candidatus Puniceispirillum sp.]
MMNIAILLAGHTNKAMQPRFPDYADLFIALFAKSPLAADFTFTSFAVVDDVFPDRIVDYDGYLVTGSAYGVYDDAPFIPKLITLIQDIHAGGKPLAGLCFGHQIIAHALGGHAQKWDGGWGLGVKSIELANLPDWIDPPIDSAKLIHVHQDQVVRLPAGGQVIARADHCDIAGYTVGDHVFTLQGHPEFDAAYTGALATLLAERGVDPAVVAAAQDTLDTPHDGDRFGHWILTFFHRHAAA